MCSCACSLGLTFFALCLVQACHGTRGAHGPLTCQSIVNFCGSNRTFKRVDFTWACMLARLQAAEDVAVKLESELTTTRMRATQLEGSLRARDKEIGQLQARVVI